MQDATSITAYGIRPWSAENLILKQGVTESNSALEECLVFAQYFVDEYATAANRVSTITFRSSPLGATGSAANWLLLSEVDINDRVAITIGSPGGGGIDGSTGQVLRRGRARDLPPTERRHGRRHARLSICALGRYYSDNPFTPL